MDVRWTEIAQACLKVDFSISNVKPSGYAVIVLIAFSLTTLTWRFKTLSQRTKSNTNLHFIMTHDKNCSHTKIILVWREEDLLQSKSAVIASNRTTAVWQFLLITNFMHFFQCIYFTSVHVLSNPVLIISRINCINTSSGIYHSGRWPSGMPVRRELHTRQSSTRVIYTRWCIDTIDSPDDEHWVARNM